MRRSLGYDLMPLATVAVSWVLIDRLCPCSNLGGVCSLLAVADAGARAVQVWGVECASVLYAAPHIALELLLLQPLLHVRPPAGDAWMCFGVS